jgi:hypothetical protein
LLTAQNNKERERNAPTIKWLKKQGLWTSASPNYSEWLKGQGFWASAKELIDSGEDYSEFPDDTGRTRKMYFSKGSGSFHAVIGYEDENGRIHNFLLPNSFTQGKNLRVTCREVPSIHLSPVKTKAQIAREVRTFQRSWPSPKSIEVTKLRYNESFWQRDLDEAAKECRRLKKKTSPENLRKYMYRDENAQWKGHRGISRSSYYRRGYTEADLRRARRQRGASNTQRLPSHKWGGIGDGLILDRDDLKNMAIRTAEGWELRNPYRD